MNLGARVWAVVVSVALLACSPSGESGPNSGSPALQDLGSSTDNFGVYTGTVGGKPGFMVTFQTLHAQPFTVTSITQHGVDVSAFGGGGRSATEQHFDFETGWPQGGGQFYEHGVLSGPNSGAVILTGVWTINERMVGNVRRGPGTDSLLYFDLNFDPITLSTEPEGNAIPAGRYDIIHGDRDIGDFAVETAGAGTGVVTWPGARTACAIGVSPGVRAPGTTRNVWQIRFDTDVNCTPPVWSVGYAVMSDGALTYELFASRQLANHGRPALAGEQDAMHLQLRRRH